MSSLVHSSCLRAPGFRRSLVAAATAIALVTLAACTTWPTPTGGGGGPCATTTTTAAASCVPPTDYQTAVAALPSLTRSLALDEASGLVAADHSANRQDGQISASGVSYGQPDTVAAAANGQRALGLSSGTGSVHLPADDQLNLGTTSAAPWMVMVSARVDSTTGYPTLLVKGDPATNGFRIFADPATGTVGYIVDGHQFAWDGMSLATMCSLALSWDGTRLHFFLDGAEIGSNAIPEYSVTDTGPLTLGADGGVTLAKLVISRQANTGAIPHLFQVLKSGSTTGSTGTTSTTQPTGGPGTTTTTTQPATNPGTTTTTSPPAGGSGAQLQWADEFSGAAGSAVDPSTWYQETGAPTNSGRVEYLTPGTHNVALDGQGDLAITARRESYGGRAFTSGRIESNRQFTTGYLEIRAKLTTWSGSSPSLWTFGAAGYGAGTGFSEVDLLETRTRQDLDPTYGRQTIHGLSPDGSLWQLGWSNNMVNFAPQMPGSAWHTYGAYISPVDHSVSFYVDGRRTASYGPGQQPAGGNWPYGTVAQKVIVDVEMGLFSGGAIGTDRNSDSMLVDYVRAYDRPPF